MPRKELWTSLEPNSSREVSYNLKENVTNSVDFGRFKKGFEKRWLELSNADLKGNDEQLVNTENDGGHP